MGIADYWSSQQSQSAPATPSVWSSSAVKPKTSNTDPAVWSTAQNAAAPQQQSSFSAPQTQSAANPNKVPATPSNPWTLAPAAQQGLNQAVGSSQVFQATNNAAKQQSAWQPNSGANIGGQYQQGSLGSYAQQGGALPGGQPLGGQWGDHAGSVLGQQNQSQYPTTGFGHTEQSGALGKALIDAIYGKAQYGVDPEVLNANMAAVQKDADKAKIQQNQMLGARGFGASGVAAADLGGIQSAADAKKADIAYQNAIDAAKQRNDMILGLGGLNLQDYQLSQALANQKEADKWTAINNVMSMLGGTKASPDSLAKILGSALGGEQGQLWKDIGGAIAVDSGGNITGFNPLPGNQLPTGTVQGGVSGQGQAPNPLVQPPTPKPEVLNQALADAGIGGSFYPQGAPALNPKTGKYQMTGFGQDKNGANIMVTFSYDPTTGQWTVDNNTPAGG